MRTTLAVASTLLLLAGCTSHVHYPLDTRTVSVSRGAPIGVFNYRPSPGAVTVHGPDGHYRGYTTRRVTMPASFENGQPGNLVVATYYASPSPGKKPLVIVLPVWGVSEYPSVKMSNTILDRSAASMNVLRVHGENRFVDWKAIERSTTLKEFMVGVANAARRLKHAVIDIRRLVDWAQTRHEISDDRIGLVGFSISAVSGTLVTQSDTRIRSSVLMMGGADIGRIVSECPGNEEQTREAIIDKLDIDIAEYEQTVDALFAGLDPADYPNRVDPRSLLIVDAGEDRCIPEQSREAWWKALGRPERISMNYSHRQSFLAMTPLGFNFLRRRAYEHLESTLSTPRLEGEPPAESSREAGANSRQARG